MRQMSVQHVLVICQTPTTITWCFVEAEIEHSPAEHWPALTGYT